MTPTANRIIVQGVLDAAVDDQIIIVQTTTGAQSQQKDATGARVTIVTPDARTLLATEIVGNAVRHAGLRGDQRIVFFARLGHDFARVEVADQGGGFDPLEVETEGFGLRLLSKLASDWGVDCTDRGCKVWFEVDRRSRRTGRFERAA